MVQQKNKKKEQNRQKKKNNPENNDQPSLKSVTKHKQPRVLYRLKSTYHESKIYIFLGFFGNILHSLEKITTRFFLIHFCFALSVIISVVQTEYFLFFLFSVLFFLYGVKKAFLNL